MFAVGKRPHLEVVDRCGGGDFAPCLGYGGGKCYGLIGDRYVDLVMIVGT